MAIEVKKGTKYIYTFQPNKAEGDASMRELLGGKGANIAEMCNLGFPVPAGLTITTEACRHYRELEDEKDKHDFVKRLAKRAYKTLKTLHTKEYMPLVSVRSGAQVSMAGMMDTILNVGLTPARFSEMFQVLGARTTLDSFRRLQQMYGSTVLGIPEHDFENALQAVKDKCKASSDQDLTEDELMSVIKAYDAAYDHHKQTRLTFSFELQLAGCIRAVFDSWDNDRAKVYRKHHGIPEDWGTAVNIQFMVFGNAQGVSGSGVMFTRDTTTGVKQPLGEFLLDAQGEDVVAGVRTPEPLSKLDDVDDVLYTDLLELATKLEEHYNDVQDIEFTIEDGTLYLLQTRDAKRTAVAEVKIASDFIKEGAWDICDLEAKLNPESFDLLAKPNLKPTDENKVLAKGLGTGGVAVGIVATNKEQALSLFKEGKDFVLWAKETTPNDLDAMLVAKAIVTETGGQTCHAAVVARSLNLPCVVGTGTPWGGDLMVTVDADSGTVYSGLVPCETMEEPAYVRELVEYIAACNDLIKSGDYIDSTIYARVETPVKDLTEDAKGMVLDVSDLEIRLGTCDEAHLTLLGIEADAYRCEVFKERLEGSPFGWVNDLVQSEQLPKKRTANTTDWGQQCSLVTLVLKSLGFKKAEVIDSPDDLITGGCGSVDEKALKNILGGALFEYVKAKAIADGVYPTEIKKVASRDEILNTLKGE